jgi:hypothetical protein
MGQFEPARAKEMRANQARSGSLIQHRILLIWLSVLETITTGDLYLS